LKKTTTHLRYILYTIRGEKKKCNITQKTLHYYCYNILKNNTHILII